MIFFVGVLTIPFVTEGFTRPSLVGIVAWLKKKTAAKEIIRVSGFKLLDQSQGKVRQH